MVAPLTPKPTRKAEALTKASPTIASRREGVAKNRFFFFFLTINEAVQEKVRDE
jgi:hypothetical protein